MYREYGASSCLPVSKPIRLIHSGNRRSIFSLYRRPQFPGNDAAGVIVEDHLSVTPVPAHDFETGIIVSRGSSLNIASSWMHLAIGGSVNKMA